MVYIKTFNRNGYWYQKYRPLKTNRYAVHLLVVYSNPKKEKRQY